MDGLRKLLSAFVYKPGWNAFIEDTSPPNLSITTTTTDSYHPERDDYHTHHRFQLPQRTPEEGWQRWLLNRVIDVETHEALEFFVVNGDRPFEPVHSRRDNTYYAIVEKTPWTG